MGPQTVWWASTILVVLLCAFSSGALKVFDSCTNSTQSGCPTNSECRPRDCDGNVCRCNTGYVPSAQLLQCYVAADLGDSCDDVTVWCRGSKTFCSQGTCSCKPSYIPASGNMRCKRKPIVTISFALLGEFCDNSVRCQNVALQTCDTVQQKCVCKDGFRPATEEEMNAEPFVPYECRETNFSLSTPVEDLNCPVPDPPISSRVDERCYSYRNCPDNADCLPRGCDRDVCVCNAGLYPTNNRTVCKPVAQIGESCDNDTVCYNEENGSKCEHDRCVCGQGSVQIQDGRCKPEPDLGVAYALYGQVCGIVNSERIVCSEEGTTCNSTADGRCVCREDMREASEEEVTRDPFNPSPCRFHGYLLDTLDSSQCEREKLFKDCLTWERDEPLWRDWFRGGQRRQDHPHLDWDLEWKKHRDRLRNCSKLKSPGDGDSWSEEHRESRQS